MDGRVIHISEGATPMYMDPFHSDHEIPVSDLQHQLAAMGVSSTEYGALLDSSSITEIIRRTARNIISAIQKGSHIHTTRASFCSSLVDSDSAFYGALWALLLLPENTSMRMGMQRALPYIVEHLKNQFFMDVGLVEQYVLPIFTDLRPIVALHHSTRQIRATDSETKVSKRRSQATLTKVKYRVGQVFRHVRYAYQAVIIGWDMECGATEQWMSQMSVDNLAYGRHQSFYHVL
jgi:F-box protein 21